MNDATIRQAQCLCGALRAATRGEPWRTMICSCRDCRRKSGSAYGLSTYWDEDAVTLSGDAQTWRRDAPEGRSLRYFFCPRCGVSLYWRADFAPGRIGIGGGNFDDCNFAVPRRAFWSEGLPHWALDLRQIPARERQ